jgi:hypothetical protein
MAAAQAAGSIISSVKPGRDVDAERVQRAYLADPTASGPGAGEAAFEGITTTPTGYAEGALGAAQEMRAEQQRALDELRRRAYGHRSLAREQMAREQFRLQGALQGAARSGRGRFGQLAGRRAHPMASSLLPGRLVAPTEALATEEMQQAMAAYQQALAQQGQQDLVYGMSQLELQRFIREAGLRGEEERYGWGTLSVKDVGMGTEYEVGKESAK